MARLTSGLMLALFLLCSGVSRGDFIEQTKAQSGSLIEGTTYRSFYLGRMFEDRDLSNVGDFTGISAIVTAGNAQSVALYAGSQPGPPVGPINIENAIANNALLNTGIIFTNPAFQGNTINTLSVGGSGGLALANSVGSTLRAQAELNNGLDFWLVAPVASTFTAPAGSIGSSGQLNSFSVRLQFTAVPEPASFTLVCIATAVGIGAGIRRKMAARGFFIPNHPSHGRNIATEIPSKMSWH